MAAAVSTPDHADPRAIPLLLARPQTLRNWLWILLAAGLAWRIIRYALNFPLWGDEAMLALNLLDHDFLDINRPLQNQQIAPPLFLVLTQAVRLTLASSSEYALRLLPLLAGLGALYTQRFVRKYLEPIAALTAFALMALSFAPVQHATEFKPYSLDLLFAVAFLFTGWRILKNPAEPASYFLFALLPILAFGLSYPSILLFGATALAILPTVIRRAPRLCQTLYALAILIALATLILLLQAAVAAQLAGAGSFMHDYWLKFNAFPPHDLSSFITWLYRAHIGAIFAYPIKNSETLAITVFFLTLLGTIRLIARKQLSFLALLLAPFALTFLAACFARYPYGGDVRLHQHLAPSIFILAGLGLSALFQILAARCPAGPLTIAAHAFFTALLILPVLGILRDFHHPFLHDPIDQTARRQARTLPDRLPPGTPFYMPQNVREIPPVFAWYLRQYIPNLHLTNPPPLPSPTASTAPTSPSSTPSPKPFALLICPATPEDPNPLPLWTRTTLLENAYRYRTSTRPIRIDLYRPLPPTP